MLRMIGLISCRTGFLSKKIDILQSSPNLCRGCSRQQDQIADVTHLFCRDTLITISLTVLEEHESYLTMMNDPYQPVFLHPSLNFLLIKLISTSMRVITVLLDLVDSTFTSYQLLKSEVKPHNISVSVDYHLTSHATITVVKRSRNLNLVSQCRERSWLIRYKDSVSKQLDCHMLSLSLRRRNPWLFSKIPAWRRSNLLTKNPS